jgi:hypothetical protein
MTYCAGDILFYGQVSGHLEDMIISGWTHSPFVHVAVVVNPVQKIEALGGGVALTLIDSRKVAAIYRYQIHATPLVQENLASALAWLHSQLNAPYGYGDILNAFWQRWERGFVIDLDGHFDCSGLATEFLIKAGGVDLGQITDPHGVTPADLAGLLHIGDEHGIYP